MTQQQIVGIVQGQLAVDLNCTVDELNGEKDSFVFVTAADNAGRRPFPRGEHHFEMLSMGKAIVISATTDLLKLVRSQLTGKTRDDAFSMPFVYGHSLYYLPDMANIRPLAEPIAEPMGFEYELLEKERIPGLYAHEGFRNALQYDVAHPRPDILVSIAKRDGRIVGMAGASQDCMKMWQVGMDVLPEYRNCGLAAYLVNRLTMEILGRGIVPYYGTASSNIASQRVAHRSGYMPAWICAYRGRFDGYELLPTC